jgi:hypothetical protein
MAQLFFIFKNSCFFGLKINYNDGVFLKPNLPLKHMTFNFFTTDLKSEI